MRRVPVDTVREGQYMAKNIYDEHGYKLISRGTAITFHMLRRLKAMGYLSLYITDDPGDEVMTAEPAIDEQKVIALRSATKQIFLQPNKAIGAEQLKQLTRLVDMIIEELVSTTIRAADDILQLNQADDETFTHSVNVMLLTILLGKEVYGTQTGQMRKLAVGALLHDLGKLQIPSHILKKNGPLTPDEYEEVKRHTLNGYDHLKLVTQLEPTVRIVALEHHERHDGTGYPFSKPGENIHEFSAITAVCDVYEALTADRIYRKGFPVHEAYEYLMGAGDTHLNYNWVKRFLKVVVPYPVGTRVRLSNQLVGTVVDVCDPYRLRPLVELEDHYLLNLAEHRNITIEQVVD